MAQKPKVEGKKPHQAVKPQRKEFASEVVGLTTHMFNIGHPKYAARSVDAIARYVQEQYKSGANIALAMRELVAPSVTMPVFPSDPNDQEALQISVLCTPLKIEFNSGPYRLQIAVARSKMVL